MSQLLQITNLSFSYGVRPILRNVELSVGSGEVVALLGPNGSGKTTLLRTVLGHLRSSGSVEWEGRGLSSWGHRELARRVAYLPQTPTFDAGQTVLDVLRLGRAAYWTAFGIESPRDAEVVESTAKLLELTELLGQPMDELSGGQRQRVLVGRCLVQEPAAMLLDEPSTFLDLRHQVELCDLLRRLSREKQIGVLMASHDLNLAGGVFGSPQRFCMTAHRCIGVAGGGIAARIAEPGLRHRNSPHRTTRQCAGRHSGCHVNFKVIGDIHRRDAEDAEEKALTNFMNGHRRKTCFGFYLCQFAVLYGGIPSALSALCGESHQCDSEVVGCVVASRSKGATNRSARSVLNFWAPLRVKCEGSRKF